MLRKPGNKQSHATKQSELHFYCFLQIRKPSQSEHRKNETPQRTPVLFPCHCQVSLNHAGLQHAREQVKESERHQIHLNEAGSALRLGTRSVSHCGHFKAGGRVIGVYFLEKISYFSKPKLCGGWGGK